MEIEAAGEKGLLARRELLFAGFYPELTRQNFSSQLNEKSSLQRSERVG